MVFAYFIPTGNDIILSNQFAAVLLWRESEVLAEETDEIRHIGETYRLGHLRDGQLRSQQQGLGMVYLLADDVLEGRDAHVLPEEAYEVGLGEAGPVGKVLHGDAPADVRLDVVKDGGYAAVLDEGLGTGMLEEVGEENLHHAMQLHALEGFHAQIGLGIVPVGLVVEEGLGIARGEVELRIEHAIVFEEQARPLIGIDLVGKVVKVVEAGFFQFGLVDEEIVELQSGLALVGMGRVAGQHIHVAGGEMHVGVFEMKHGLTAPDVEETDKG